MSMTVPSPRHMLDAPVPWDRSLHLMLTGLTQDNTMPGEQVMMLSSASVACAETGAMPVSIRC